MKNAAATKKLLRLCIITVALLYLLETLTLNLPALSLQLTCKPQNKHMHSELAWDALEVAWYHQMVYEVMLSLYFFALWVSFHALLSLYQVTPNPPPPFPNINLN